MYTMMQACKETNMSYQALKYYCNEGLVPNVKRDSNNFFDFMEAEDYIRLKADACISSKDLYAIYKMWCEENNLVPLKARSFSDNLIANLKKYNLEHTNNILNAAGRRVWGYLGMEALVRPEPAPSSWGR